MSEKIPAVNIDAPGASKSARAKRAKRGKGAAVAHSALTNDVYQGKIYTRRVKGYFQRLRRYSSFILLALYLVLPWVEIAGRPSVYFDLGEQKFHIFWMSFWPQDAVFLMWLLVLAAFLLFTVTVVVGRAWCGFACPQTVWTFLFMWVEDKCEGDRNKRIKLDSQPWSAEKLMRKLAKHALWLLISVITAVTFVGYFYEIKPLVSDMATFDAHYIGVSWVLFFTLGTYLNAGWLREKVCQHMCPYSRFQSVMYNEDTLVVSYDATRGENRGKRKVVAGDTPRSEGMGDCVDCSWCVQVCPVDIDIRDGLQFACIDCGLCADACDNVMDKMGYERGLIRFSSANALAGVVKSKWSPRLLGYSSACLLVVAAFIYSLSTRDVLSVDVVRDRSGELYHIVNGAIENSYTVNVNNKASGAQHFELTVSGDHPFEVLGETKVYVPTGKVDTLRVRVRLATDSVLEANSALTFVVSASDEGSDQATQASSFIAPVVR